MNLPKYFPRPYIPHKRRKLYCFAFGITLMWGILAGYTLLACLLPLYGILEWYDGRDTHAEIYTNKFLADMVYVRMMTTVCSDCMLKIHDVIGDK